MKLIINILLFSLFLLPLMLVSCDDTITSSDIDKIIIPDENVSYKTYIQPVFNLKCASSGCHDDIKKVGNYSMTSWSNVLSVGIVIPFDVENSRLVWRIEGLDGDLMPPLGVITPLTENQIEGIKTWIREGAENN